MTEVLKSRIWWIVRNEMKSHMLNYLGYMDLDVENAIEKTALVVVKTQAHYLTFRSEEFAEVMEGLAENWTGTFADLEKAVEELVS